MLSDTIAAIATPLGEGGIGVIRISGPDALKVIKKLFKPSRAGQFMSHKIRHGWVLNGSKEIDQVVVSYMAAPNSYTGEDVAEISCHGGSLVLKTVLGLAITAGARLAQRGEFTKRAFLNGKIDLTQAEAVIDLIRAKTVEGSSIAAAQLKGSLSFKIKAIRSDLMGLLAEIEASIDFPDEIPDIDAAKAAKVVKGSISGIDDLVRTADIGRVYREGVSVAIVGRPNVGKSSLLNALMKEERAIVTEEPGTTRDTIEETLNIQGIPVVVIDTAGIRHSTHKAEMIGVDRAVNALEKADMVLLVIDRSEPLTNEDIELANKTKGMNRIVVLNKSDKPHRIKRGEAARLGGTSVVTVEVSALKGDGIGELEQAIFDSVASNKVVAGNIEVMVNLRHRESLVRAKELLQKALDSLEGRMQADFVSIDIKGAVAALGEVTGEVVSEEVIDRIFEDFCIGK